MESIQSGPDSVSKVRQVEGLIQVIKEYCLLEADKLSDPGARALLKTSVKVLDELTEEFEKFLLVGKAPWESFEETPQRSADPWD